MDEERCKQLIRQRAAAKASITRLQKYIDSGDRKFTQLQIRYDELPVVVSKFEVAQNELETLMSKITKVIENILKNNILMLNKSLWNYCTQTCTTIIATSFN